MGFRYTCMGLKIGHWKWLKYRGFMMKGLVVLSIKLFCDKWSHDLLLTSVKFFAIGFDITGRK